MRDGRKGELLRFETKRTTTPKRRRQQQVGSGVWKNDNKTAKTTTATKQKKTMICCCCGHDTEDKTRTRRHGRPSCATCTRCDTCLLVASNPTFQKLAPTAVALLHMYPVVLKPQQLCSCVRHNSKRGVTSSTTRGTLSSARAHLSFFFFFFCTSLFTLLSPDLDVLSPSDPGTWPALPQDHPSPPPLPPARLSRSRPLPHT